MAKLLFTGGSGFIGKNLVPALRESHEVLAPRHSELELTDAESVRAYLGKHRPDVVVHGATKPGHRNAVDSSGLLEANERMYFNLVRDRELCPRMIFLSSGAVYDALHYSDRMPESALGDHVPADEHGFGKYVIARHIEQSEGITELRIFGIFGPHEDYAIRFVSNAICKTLFDLPVTLRQDRRFDYLWAEDLVPVIEHFIGTPGGHAAYNVTPDATDSLRALGELVIAVSGKDLPLEVAQDGLGVPYSGDNARLRAEMPTLQFTPIEEAVRTLYRWYEERAESIDRSLLEWDR